MARPKNTVPTYRRHKPSDTARYWLNGRWVTLGKWNSPESRAEHARILAELAASGPSAATHAGPDDATTVDEVLLAFWKHAEQHYRRADGTNTHELMEYRQTFKVVRPLYGHTPAARFGPLALKAVREKMIDAGWCRGLVNRRVNRVRRVFKWAASEQLVPTEVYTSLATVTGLQRGRCRAPEAPPVRPVEERHVLATLPHLRPETRAMVQVQLLTGMRPGEVCQLRPCDIDTSAAVWVFRPEQHKRLHAGKERVVAIGPKAQAILRRFAPRNPTDYYFSPRRAVEQFHAERGRARKTPKYPSHMKRNADKRAEKPLRLPAALYSVSSYGHAIARAVEKANRALVAAGVAVGQHVPRWHPNQLRHAHGTAVRHRYGLEGAQVALGHARADVTQVYAERDQSLAAKIAAEMG